jgi:elongation factor G
MKRGPLGRGPLVGVRFDLVGGKTHSHDSSDRAFFIAGRDGFREAIRAFRVVVLEPVVALDVSTSRVADALHALAGRDIVALRADGVSALVPQSSLDALGDALLSRTGGEAEWTWRPSHYAPLTA